MTTSNQISFYVDTMIVETLLSDPGLSKTAQAQNILSDIAGKVSHYFENHIRPDDKAGSLLDLFAPGLVWVTLRAIGLPWWFTTLLSLAMDVFHIDVRKIMSSIYSKLKSLLSGNKEVSSSQIDSIVSSSVQENASPATQEEADQVEQMISKSYSVRLREAKLLKLAMIEYHKMKSEGQAKSKFFSLFSNRKAGTVSSLTSVLSWIIKIALASAGLLVAGDVVNKFLGRPNALDNTIQKGKPVEKQETVAPVVVSKQTKFPLNPAYHEENLNSAASPWIENVTNNKESIEEMLVNFAKEVYQGLDGHEADIKASPRFQSIADSIVWYNHTSAGGPIVFIPKMFTSKKRLVDYFIDDVAARTP